MKLVVIDDKLVRLNNIQPEMEKRVLNVMAGVDTIRLPDGSPAYIPSTETNDYDGVSLLKHGENTEACLKTLFDYSADTFHVPRFANLGQPTTYIIENKPVQIWFLFDDAIIYESKNIIEQNNARNIITYWVIPQEDLFLHMNVLPITQLLQYDANSAMITCGSYEFRVEDTLKYLLLKLCPTPIGEIRKYMLAACYNCKWQMILPFYDNVSTKLERVPREDFDVLVKEAKNIYPYAQAVGKLKQIPDKHNPGSLVDAEICPHCKKINITGSLLRSAKQLNQVMYIDDSLNLHRDIEGFEPLEMGV